MKILINNNGFEILDKFIYSYKLDSYRRKRIYYKFIPSCIECGESYFMRISYPTKFCSIQCVNKSTEVRNKISKSLTGHKRSKEECLAISKRMSKGGVVKKNIPLYDTYAKQLIPIEEIRNSNDLLEARCTNCNNWFIPNRTSVEARAQFIKDNTDRESRLYCSDECKESCSIFNKHKYPKGKNIRKSRNNTYFTENQLRVWAKEVLKREDNICEYCGKLANTAHHILPKKTNQFFALDPDNGVACCAECHYKYGHRDECSSINIAKITC